MIKRISKEYLEPFFNGYIYPVIVCLLVLISHITSAETVFNVILLSLLSLSLIVSESVRPALIVIMTYVFHFARVDSASDYSSDDCHFVGFRLVLFITMAVIFGLCVVYYLYKKRLFSIREFKSLPILPSAILLSAAFLMNGAFSGGYTFRNLAQGFSQICAFFAFFYILYVCLKGHHPKETARYLSYLCSLVVLLLLSQMVYLFITNEALFKDGSIVKEQIVFGWGIWNTMGQFLALMIPTCFLGVMKNKYPWYYFTVATLALVGAIMTLSRNALLVSFLVYCVSCIIAMFYGNVKKQMRITVCVGIVGIIIICIVLREKISLILADYLNRGLSDNGRFELWREGMERFKEAVIFGGGFFGFKFDEPYTFPLMYHTTPVTLLATCGIFGFACYVYYRIMTVRRVLKKPTLEKTMLFLSISVLLLGSLLDNFIFYIHHMIYPSVALAILFRQDEE